LILREKNVEPMGIQKEKRLPLAWPGWLGKWQSGLEGYPIAITVVRPEIRRGENEKKVGKPEILGIY